jgi:hypothetical protein
MRSAHYNYDYVYLPQKGTREINMSKKAIKGFCPFVGALKFSASATNYSYTVL